MGFSTKETKERYKRGYQFLAKSSSDKDVIKNYLRNEFHDRWSVRKNNIKVLDVGCAEGDITSCLLENMGLQPENVKLTLIEPLKTLLAQAIDQIKCENIPLNMTYEQYISTIGNSQKYDMVFSCHSIYHTGLKSIQQMYSSLDEGGTLLIIVSSSDDPFIEIKKLFPKIVTIAGDSVVEEMKRLGYKKIFKDSKKKILNVKGCVDSHDRLTEDGKDLASLLFYNEYEDLTPIQQKAALEFLREHSKTNGIEYYNDFIWVMKRPLQLVQN